MRIAARFLALTLTASAAAAGAACAQDAPVQTAPAAAPASPTDAPPPKPAASASAANAPAASNTATASNGGSDLDRWLKQAPPVKTLGSDYDSGVITDASAPQPDRGVHGEVGFGVGSGGYRDMYAAATMPIGKTGELGVAIEDTQYSRPFKINARRLDVNLALGGGNAAAPADCEDALRVGDRFVEPLWVTRMRGSALVDADPRCISADPGPQPR